MKIKEYTEFKKDEIWQLYTQVGWTAYTENMTALERGYKNSLLVLAAYENEELLGIVRVVGDGATIILVQDILVYPQKQRQGKTQNLFPGRSLGHVHRCASHSSSFHIFRLQAAPPFLIVPPLETV